MFEETVFLRRDNNDQLTVAEPVGFRGVSITPSAGALGPRDMNAEGGAKRFSRPKSGVPSYMQPTQSSKKKFALK